MNGDGKIDSTVRNPVYTYCSYGRYTVSLTSSNSEGSDTMIKPGYIEVIPFSINSASPERDIITYRGEEQTFNISTNSACNVNWYLNGDNRKSESCVKNSSHRETIHYTGLYNVTVVAEIGSEKVIQSWSWTVRSWNPWDSPVSQEGEKISTQELQEAIYIYLNGLQIPETGAELTKERLKELILLWQEGSGR